jgi:cation diffusion facilitator CzcD-associated flavoprotein CzcO
MRRHRRHLYRQSLNLHRVFRRQTGAAEALRNVCLRHMRAAISDPGLIAALTPRYEPGCKRILVSDDYYPALALDHVQLHAKAVERLTGTGVVAVDGSETQVDAVIFCTGYKLGGRKDGRPALEVLGRGGRRLLAALAERPEAYRGVAVPGFPNYFTVCGINGVAAYTSLFASAEIQSEHIVGCLQSLVSSRCNTLEVDVMACRRYNESIQAELQAMSWAGDCPSFYRDAAGRILSFFPGTLGRMRRELRTVGDADYVADSM